MPALDKLRQKAIALARRLNLLEVLEKIRYGWKLVSGYRANYRYHKLRQELVFPPSDLMYETVSAVSLESYIARGQFVASFLYALFEEHHKGPIRDIYEWGCGPGRVLRHLPSFITEPTVQLYGSDYEERSIAWASKSLPGINFCINDLTPPLPFADQSFDIVYCTSVFTHLSQHMHGVWLDELLRVLREHGTLVMTTHGDSFRHKLLGQEIAEYDSGKLVVRSSSLEGARTYTAFQSPIFMRNTLLSGLDVKVHLESPDSRLMGGQDVWVVGRP